MGRAGGACSGVALVCGVCRGASHLSSTEMTFYEIISIFILNLGSAKHTHPVTYTCTDPNTHPHPHAHTRLARRWNCLDGSIVLLSIFEMLVTILLASLVSKARDV